RLICIFLCIAPKTARGQGPASVSRGYALLTLRKGAGRRGVKGTSGPKKNLRCFHPKVAKGRSGWDWDARALQEREYRIHSDLESCRCHREVTLEAWSRGIGGRGD